MQNTVGLLFKTQLNAKNSRLSIIWWEVMSPAYYAECLLPGGNKLRLFYLGSVELAQIREPFLCTFF